MWWKVTASKKRWSVLPGRETRKSPNRSESEHLHQGIVRERLPAPEGRRWRIGTSKDI